MTLQKKKKIKNSEKLVLNNKTSLLKLQKKEQKDNRPNAHV